MKKYKLSCLVGISLALVVALFITPGCGGSKNATDNATTEKVVTQETVGVAIYPDTLPEEIYPGVYKMVTGDGFDEVVAFYKEELSDASFSEITIPSGKGASFVVDESDFHGNVSVEENMPESGKVTVTVSRITTR